jgi:hypothetical protein
MRKYKISFNSETTMHENKKKKEKRNYFYFSFQEL